ncbi:exported hypothetical protein [Enterobacterales bacterium 8AC]|nr:exported hypothetical protein [Enterobacterales bacterium 8AC]
MKFSPALILALLFTINVAQAGVIVGGTRLIYDGDKKESSLSVKNPDKTPYLIQTWIETTGGAEKAPFIVTPPLFRLDGGRENVLRVVRTGGNLPEDKESLEPIPIGIVYNDVKKRWNRYRLNYGNRLVNF